MELFYGIRRHPICFSVLVRRPQVRERVGAQTTEEGLTRKYLTPTLAPVRQKIGECMEGQESDKRGREPSEVVRLRQAVAIRLARRCRWVIQGCLREEEWQDADREFFFIINEGIRHFSEECRCPLH